MTVILNPILWADSYKQSHFKQYPEGVDYVSSYIEARPGTGMQEIVFFGLFPYLFDHLREVPNIRDIEQAAKICEAHAVPFNKQGWLKINDLGYYPLEIQALPEGTVVGRGVPLVQLRNTLPEFEWLPSYLETSLLSSVWYPTTVATVSRTIKKVIMSYLEKSSDDPEGNIGFGLNDFGVRGASSKESAMIGGMAHLVNFIGTDNLPAIFAASAYYGENMAGFSVPATEHSTMTAWGREGELAAIENMLDQFPDGIVSVVLDSYDLEHAIEQYIGVDLRDKIIARGERGGRFVVRPDSGDPVRLVTQTVRQLDEIFGSEVNDKGYKVLPSCVRVIQGDGVDQRSIDRILLTLTGAGYSAENVIFGMGGALLQQPNRDTLRFAQKANAVGIAYGDHVEWTDIQKMPKTDPTKASKLGRQGVYIDGFGEYKAAHIDQFKMRGMNNELITVFRDGKFYEVPLFSEIRERAKL